MEIYQRIFEFMPDGLLVVDQTGKIEKANVQAARMFRYELGELLGQPVEILVPQPLRTRHAQHRSQYSSDPHLRPMGVGLELLGRRKDGSEFPVDIMLSPIEAASRAHTLCAVRDVSERRREMDMFRTVLESAPDAMLLVNKQGKIILANSTTERVFGHPRSELLGNSVDMLVPERIRPHNPLLRNSPGSHPEGEVYCLRQDGTEFPVEVTCSPLQTDDTVLLSVVRDITERKRAERILDSLQEKEAMLKEIHHRVKNNLAVISSLFYLQSTYTHDENTIRILRESQDRVRSMALVHETLYRSENLAAVDFAAYARELSGSLFRSHVHPACAVQIRDSLQSTLMGIDIAIPCGLILNELITNALKHAFVDRERGAIDISLTRDETGACVLIVSDDGRGIPDDLEVESSPSLGLRLIRSLTRQLDAKFDLSRTARGTEAKLVLEIR